MTRFSSVLSEIRKPAPDPDLTIRANGERHLSVFRPRQLTHAGWAELHQRDRRSGAVMSDVLPGALQQK